MEQQLQQAQLASAALPGNRLSKEAGNGLDLMSIGQCHTIGKTRSSSLVGSRDESGTGDAVVKQADWIVGCYAGKRKRGRPPKNHAQMPQQPRPPPPKEDEEEDVCFICFDGGSLVLCDRRGCPKAYHPACIKRDEAFFRSKAKWNCGWHICSTCEKASHYMCYTCTYSVCKRCIKDADFSIIRANKGFCGTCIKPIMLIEQASLGQKEAVQVDFDDKTSWEYLFKVYWLCLKEKLSLSLDEIIKAKNPWKIAISDAPKLEQPHELRKCSNDRVLHTNYSHDYMPINHAKRHKRSSQPSFPNDMGTICTQKSTDRPTILPYEETKWATEELLEFVTHMKNGDTSILSQSDVQALLLAYIKRHNLRDPNQKSQIICDLRLLKLFGRERVGHFEMFSLLESHFLIEESTAAINAINFGVSGSIPYQIEPGGNPDNQIMGSDRESITCKMAEDQGPAVNPGDYAAIDVHNINLIYLRRDLMEKLIEDLNNFHEKVVGSIVRIRISDNDQKQDIYRLVQVVGTCKATTPYQVGSRRADVMLEISNLDKKEAISVDGISNQDFTEDECKLLRRSIICGLNKPMTVGEIQQKARTLKAVNVNDVLEAEKSQITHLRDLANEKGHRKDLRECIEKLDVLNSPEELWRRLQDIPQVHTDPSMHPGQASTHHLDLSLKRKDNYERAGSFSTVTKEQEVKSFQDTGSNLKHSGNSEQKELTPAFLQKNSICASFCVNKSDVEAQASGKGNELPWYQGKGSQGQSSPNIWVGSCGSNLNSHAVVKPEPSAIFSDALSTPPIAHEEQNNEAEEVLMWKYQGPYGKIHGPFSMMQLRKWSKTGLFPRDLRIWRISEKQDCSVLLTDALAGRMHKSEVNGNLPSLEVRLADSDSNQTSDSGHTSAAPAGGIDKSGEVNGNFHSQEVRPVISDRNHTSDSGHTSDELAGWMHKSGEVHGNLHSQEVRPAVSDRNHTSGSGHASDSRGWSAIVRAAHLESKKLDVNLNSSYVDSPADSSCNDGFTGNSTDKDIPNSNNCVAATTAPASDNLESDGSRSHPQLSFHSSSMILGNAHHEAKTDSGAGKWNASQRNANGGFIKNMVDLNNDGCVLEKQDDSDGNATQSQGQNWSAPPVSSSSNVWDSDAGLVSFTNLLKATKLNQEIDFPDLPSHPPKSNAGDLEAQTAEVKSSSLLAQSSGLSLSTTCSLMVGGSQFPDVTAQVTHSSPWPAILAEPDECDESVSDLLAEVEAMESMNGLPSPTSHLRNAGEMMRISENDRFNLEELSPPREASKSDTLSSANNLQLPSQTTASDEPIVVAHAGMTSSHKFSSGASSITTEIEDPRPSDGSVNQYERNPSLPTPPPPARLTCHGLGPSDYISRTGSEAHGNERGTVYSSAAPGYLSSRNGGSSHYTPRQNVSSVYGTASTHRGAWGHQDRYRDDRGSCHRDRDLQGSGRSRTWWTKSTRQPTYANPHGSGYSRAPPKGQRPCKFYENGNCKKGASCSFWHP